MRRLLHRRVEEVVGVLGDELVEGGRVRHQHRHRRALAPPRAARLLPGRGHAARIAEEHGHVEAADVDPQLQGVGRDDAEHRPVAQPALDLAALHRQVAAAVPADHALRSRPRLQGVLQVRDEDLRREPRRREHDRLQALLQEGEGDVAGAAEGGPADAELPVHDRRVVDREVALAARRAALVDERHLAAGEALGQLLRVADGGGRAEELRVASRRTRRAGAAAGRCWPRASRRRRGRCAARPPPRSGGSRTASPTSCGGAGSPCGACRGS